MSRGAALQEISLAANVHFVYAGDLLSGAGPCAYSPTPSRSPPRSARSSRAPASTSRSRENENLILVKRPAATAQYFHGTLRTAARGTPVAAAIVTLLDTSRTIQAKARSDEQGRFVLRTTDAGLVRLRVQRIGVRPFESMPFRMRRDTTAVIALDELPAVALPRGVVDRRVRVPRTKRRDRGRVEALGGCADGPARDLDHLLRAAQPVQPRPGEAHLRHAADDDARNRRARADALPPSSRGPASRRTSWRSAAT